MMPSRSVSGGPVLVFDGDCGFCTSSAHWVARRWSEESTAIPWQELGNEGLLRLGLTEEQAMVSVWWVEPGGPVLGAEQAVAKALLACGRPWRWIGAAMLLPPGRRLGRLLYPVIARHRHRLPGGTPACRTESGVQVVDAHNLEVAKRQSAGASAAETRSRRRQPGPGGAP
jgi:predicted DCC family thiol-disulfide oxidoreductase YuxK